MRCALLMAAMLAARPLGAQGLQGVSEGEPVRVATLDAGPRLYGVFVRVRNDTLYVRRDGETVGVPTSQVRGIEVRRERTALEGMGHGMTIGAPIGLLAGYGLALGLEGGGWDCIDRCGENRILTAALGAAVGAGVGMLFGAELPGTRWERITPRPNVAVRPVPGGGVALGLDLKL